ncbi:MAG: hypothetical protein ACTTI3_05875 [Treponema sp.]
MEFEKSRVYTALNADELPLDYVHKALEHCKKHTENEYLLQTKNTDNLAMFFQMLNECFSLCTTLETNRTYRAIMNASPSILNRVLNFARIPTEHKHITIEPIIDFDLFEFVKLITMCNPVQVNIGADSSPKRNGLPEPPKEKILALISELEKFTTVVQKKNLARLLK